MRVSFRNLFATNTKLLSLFRTSMAATVQGSVTAITWGFVNNREIKKFTLRNEVHQEVDVITYGAIVTAIRTPDKEGNIADVVLGFDNIEGKFQDCLLIRKRDIVITWLVLKI